MKKIHLKGIDVRSAVKVLLPFYLFTFLPLNAHDWEDQSILQFNREPARADFHHAGEISLNGEWKFNWTLTPDEQPDGFWQTDFNDSSWKTFPVDRLQR